MAIPQIAPVEADDTLPEAVDVVVVGAGIVGACTALALQRKGLSVAVCEKGVVAGEQSSRNWGWCRKMGRDPREMPLIIEAMRMWGGMNDAVGGETGFRVCGITYFADTQADIDKYAAWLEHVEKYQIDTRIVSAEEVQRFAPGATRRWAGGLHTASDGRAEPSLATSAILQGARNLGATLHVRCAVRGVETENGKVAAAVTERGRIRCRAVVAAGGAWTSLFCRNLGIRLPQLKMQSQVMRTEPLEGGPEGCGSGNGFGFRKRLDGGYNVSMRSGFGVDIVPDSFRFFRDFRAAAQHERKVMRLRIGRRSFQELTFPNRWRLDQVTPFERIRTLDPEPSDAVLAQAKVNMASIFPVFARMRVAEKVAGYVDVTPDAIPVISPVETVPGFFISTGYSGHGFGIAPAAGRLMADLVAGDQPIVDPAAFRFSRFTDGSKIVHWPMTL